MRFRYGRFNIDDYIFTFLPGGFVAGASFLLIAMGDDSSGLYAYLGILIGVWLIVAAIVPRLERYSIAGNRITIRKGLLRREIELPGERILVVSHADVASIQAVRGSVGSSLGLSVLHGRYALTILRKMPLESAVERIHAGHLPRYTNATIEDTCSDHYVYSFVVDEKQLRDLLSEENSLVIVPESAVRKFHSVFAEYPRTHLYIDRGY